MVVQVTIFQDGILLNTLQASSRLPHFAYLSTKLFPTKTSDSQPLWMSCSWTSLPSSSAPKPAHAFSNPTKVNLSGLNHSHCICWKNCIAFSGCPSFAYFVSLLFCKKCAIALCLVPLQPSLLPPMVRFVGPQARVLPVSFYVGNQATFHLSTTRNPNQAEISHVFSTSQVS